MPTVDRSSFAGGRRPSDGPDTTRSAEPEAALLRLFVVVANYNSPLETDACIRSLEEADGPLFDQRVVVIDNSDSGLSYSHPGIQVIRPGENVGLGEAWARGFAFAESERANYCLFLNNDALVTPDFFYEMKRGIDTHGRESVLGPRILTADGSGRVWSRGGTISVWRASVHHLGGHDDAALPSQDFETGHLSGCCLLAPVELLRRIGGPDGRFFFRGEEWDLNHRLSKIGARLMVCDRARVYHRIGRSHDRFSPRMLYFAYRAKVLFARKHQARLWFPVWYAFGLAYAFSVGPLKFLVWSGRSASWSDLRAMQRALTGAFLDGLGKDRIEGADYFRHLDRSGTIR